MIGSLRLLALPVSRRPVDRVHVLTGRGCGLATGLRRTDLYNCYVPKAQVVTTARYLLPQPDEGLPAR